MNQNFTPWATARPYQDTAIGWLSAEDNERIQSYNLYEQMYWGVPDAFKLVPRSQGDDVDPPIYVPAPKVIIEGCNRFLAKGWDYFVDPLIGTPDDQLLAKTALATLFKREEMYVKFKTQKRFGLIRGDSVWHVVGDLDKPPNRRISCYEVDPAAYFPIYDLEFPDRLVGVHLAEPFLMDPLNPSTLVTRRQTYRKDPVSGVITSEITLWEQAKWDDRYLLEKDLKQVAVIQPVTPLDPRITTLPVYHIKNFRTPQGDFGSSELRGLERIAAAVNQAITDEELALALAGLGQYVTDSGAPVDEEGNESDWILGPGRVVEIQPDRKFDRVAGITSVTPSLDHIQFLLAEMRRGAGLGDTAVGRVDVQVAESGIALALDLSPILAANEEKTEEMLSVYDHMFFDLMRGWFPAYEGLTLDVSVGAVVGDPMPKNRKEEIAEMIQLMTAGLISREYIRQRLQEMGYNDLPDSTDEDVLAEQSAMRNAIGSDPFAERLRAEIDATGAPVP